jgi:alkanesulfonate monooxygenase SsuD/methylene tetrahydromethanopterin reductase-like flavin-dependent oxidoreductase (luciferase family)
VVTIRTGVVVPTFRATPADALDAAQAAYAAGVDGVFCYDHLWPIGQPDRPALAPFPVLAAIAAAGDGTGYLGTLVARVGLVPGRVLVSQFAALEHLAPGRVIAGLGTGDSLSEAENLAYGIPFPSAAERRADMVAVAGALKDLGITVWVAAGHGARAVEAQAAGVALTLWDASPEAVAAATGATGAAETAGAAGVVEVTWAGPPPATSAQLHSTVRSLARAGATWAVFGGPIDPADLAVAAKEA